MTDQPAPTQSPLSPDHAPVPETPEGGPLTHLEAAVARHLGPYLADIRADLADARVKAGNADIKAEKPLAWLKDHAANAEKMAALIAKLIAAADPAAASTVSGLLPEAEAIAVEAARIAGEILAVGAVL